MDMTIGETELLALYDIAEGRDPFSVCHVRGDYGRCMLVLATLRRAGLIDHRDHLTDAGRGMLSRHAA